MKHRTSTRILAMLLLGAMVIGLIPISAQPVMRGFTTRSPQCWVQTLRKPNLAPVPPFISYYDVIEAGFKQNGLPKSALREALSKVWREYEVFQKQKKRQQER